MEKQNNLTAERSLEIITEQIAQSRKNVSKSVGQSLYIAGICMMGTCIAITLVNHIFQTPLGHLLWFALPAFIWLAMRKKNNEQEHVPATFVGTMVAKTWSTFCIFVLGFFFIALVWGFFANRWFPPSESVHMQIRVTPVIVLLMGMAVTITGHILRQRWLVIFGIIAGLGCFMWEHLGIGKLLLIVLRGQSPDNLAISFSTLPCLTFVIFAFIGLTLPGLMLKRQK